LDSSDNKTKAQHDKRMQIGTVRASLSAVFVIVTAPAAKYSTVKVKIHYTSFSVAAP